MAQFGLGWGNIDCGISINHGKLGSRCRRTVCVVSKNINGAFSSRNAQYTRCGARHKVVLIVVHCAELDELKITLYLESMSTVHRCSVSACVGCCLY